MLNDIVLGKPIQNTNYVRISIRDNGKGMSNEVLAQAFDAFYTTKDTGSGLGSGSLHLIKNLGGFVVAVSKENIGTTIELYLPINQ